MPLAKDTELVAFGVCHDNPRLVTLANVDTLRAMSLKASHLGVLIIRPEVEMQPALSLLALIKPNEVQPWQAIRLRADLELLVRGVDHNPAKSRSPPLPQGLRIHRVDKYLFPFQGHSRSLAHRPSRNIRGWLSSPCAEAVLFKKLTRREELMDRLERHGVAVDRVAVSLSMAGGMYRS
jgi:hypothetical protein